VADIPDPYILLAIVTLIQVRETAEEENVTKEDTKINTETDHKS
jgi:hypothetical protein